MLSLSVSIALGTTDKHAKGSMRILLSREFYTRAADGNITCFWCDADQKAESKDILYNVCTLTINTSN